MNEVQVPPRERVAAAPLSSSRPADPVRRWTLTLAEELEFSDFRLFEQNIDNI